MVRLLPLQGKRLDQWRNAQTDKPGRPEAIRRLVEQALPSASSAAPSRTSTAEKAAKFAAEAIEKVTDKSQPSKEQNTRKRRLIGGPREFRDMRRDQAKRRE